MNPQRWSFVVPTALGRTQSSYEFAEAALCFQSDDVFGGSATLPWDSIGRGATAAMPGLGGPGGPDFPDWVPDKVEWLLLARTAGQGEPFMRMLPQGADRDAIVAALQARLGDRWLGVRLPLKDAQARLGMVAPEWGTLKVAGIVVGVLALLALLIMLMGVLLHPIVSVPAGIALSVWLIRKGLAGLRNVDAAQTGQSAPVSAAPLGRVALEGRAVAPSTTPSGITGRPCVWWDVTLHAASVDSGQQIEWQQLASRCAGTIGVVELDDGNARIPVWLHGADLILQTRSWDSGSDPLPEHGQAFLQSLGFSWGSHRRLRVSETGLQADAPLYVIGTLEERRHVAVPHAPQGLARIPDLIRSGKWRRELVAAVPAPARIVVAVLIGYVDMLVSLGHGQDRVRPDAAATIPDLAPTDRLVWQGSAGEPFIVSDRPRQDALNGWRTRSRWLVGLGTGVLAFTAYALVDCLSN
jgi:hypothetical protein